MSRTWRLVLNDAADGATNMAVDEAIVESVAAGEAPPTLRLYAWDPACLSLGHAQPFGVVDTAALAALGWDVVRRPTGGRALLHVDELTYAVIAPGSLPDLAGGILPSYRRLSLGLVAALRRLGVEADAPVGASPGDGDRSNPVCFEVPSAYEITVGGKKLIGSAQLRRRNMVLQHGSLPLVGDITRVLRVLRFRDPAEREAAAHRLRHHATTLESVLGRPVPWQAAAAAVRAGFAEGLGWDLAEGGLTEAERSLAARLAHERYRPVAAGAV